MPASESGYDESVLKKKKRKYYHHPFDQFHEDLLAKKKETKKIENLAEGIFFAFLIFVMILALI